MDERLRRLERTWREGGGLPEGVAFLRERERAGALTRERLELAAHLGHAPARLVLDLPGAPPPRGDRLPARLFTPGVALPLASAAEGRPLVGLTLDDALTVHLRVEGALNSAATWFLRALDELASLGVRRLVLTAAGVRFANSTSLGALVRVADLLNSRGGGLALVGIDARVRLVVEMLGLTTFLHLTDDLDEARAVVPVPAPGLPAEPRAWLLRLARWGPAACVRAALAAAEQSTAVATPQEAAADAAAREWLACPCSQHRRQARAAFVRAGQGWSAVAATVAGVGAWPLGLAEGAPLRDEAAVRAAVVAWALS